jgi:hypothetical protein
MFKQHDALPVAVTVSSGAALDPLGAITEAIRASASST